MYATLVLLLALGIPDLHCGALLSMAANTRQSTRSATDVALAAAPTFKRRFVEQQLIGQGIDDPAVITAMCKVPREEFMPAYARQHAYDDAPHPIGYHQTISQPYIVAYMTEAAQLTPESNVLEIGTGSGYQAAILGEICDEVYSVEVVPELAEQASNVLASQGYTNIHTKTCNGFEGWPEHGPYDAIIVTAAPSKLPMELVDQLKPGGRMVIPVGKFFQELVRVTKSADGKVRTEELLPVRFVPMVKSR